MIKTAGNHIRQIRKLKFLTAIATAIVTFGAGFGALAEQEPNAASSTAALGSGSHGASVSPSHCSLQANIEMTKAGRGRGYGRIFCEHADGREEILPIRLQSIGSGLKAKALVGLRVVSFPLHSGAQSLLGTYILSRRQEARVVGSAIRIETKAVRHGSALPLVAQFKRDAVETKTRAASLSYIQISHDPKNVQARHLKE